MSRLGAWAGAGALVLASFAIGTWRVGAPPSAASASPDGEVLFTIKGCSACHVGPDTDAANGSQYPPLDDAQQWAGERQPGISAEDYLAQSMVAPDAFISPAFRGTGSNPGGSMPVLTLTAAEVDSLVAYLLET